MDMATEEVFDASTVYIVDDAADYRFLVQQVFTRFLPKYTIVLFPGGDALLNHLETGSVRPALILLDLHMPGMSGQQTLTQLKKNLNWKSIPVVIVTSSSSAQDIQACYEAGANSCLVKPMGLDLIRQRLTLICDYWIDTNRPVLA